MFDRAPHGEDGHPRSPVGPCIRGALLSDGGTARPGLRGWMRRRAPEGVHAIRGNKLDHGLGDATAEFAPCKAILFSTLSKPSPEPAIGALSGSTLLFTS